VQIVSHESVETQPKVHPHQDFQRGMGA